jgi:hypothetical protein
MVEVFSEGTLTGDPLTCIAYLTFVTVDRDGGLPVPRLPCSRPRRSDSAHGDVPSRRAARLAAKQALKA